MNTLSCIMLIKLNALFSNHALPHRLIVLRSSLRIRQSTTLYTSSWPHLGNIIDDSGDDCKCIAARRFKVIGQVNNILSKFGKLDSITKNALLHTFCSSLYGSVTWNLSHTEIDRVCSTWRIALRRIWRRGYSI